MMTVEISRQESSIQFIFKIMIELELRLLVHNFEKRCVYILVIGRYDIIGFVTSILSIRYIDYRPKKIFDFSIFDYFR
jgi:hypothetical protein